MASSQDTEITLGTGRLLLLFFGLVGVCAVFFALGYTLGRKSDPGTAAANAATPQAASSKSKSGGATQSTGSPAMSFYKAVEQKDPNADLGSPADSKADANTTASAAAAGSGSAAVDPATTLPGAAYFVQVAAVTKQEDADALVDALKKKEYPAFVSAQSGSDKLFRVQLGPFGEVKDAETMRTRLIGDGYSPILKR